MTKLSGNEISKAYKDWAQDQISGLNKTRLDIGKFLFGVSIASVGAFLGISKTIANGISCIDWIAILCFVFSAFIGIAIFLPWRISLFGDYDLQALHSQQVRKLLSLTYIWVLLWVIGLVTTAFALA